ncbi:GDP-L-fucose synthase [Alphaproteobacteria bacterium]|nr:GDP-L-fucose synthase [Alphaproteobacteria bacterium]
MMQFPKVFIAGHRGMVGSAIYRSLVSQGYSKECLLVKNRDELDLTNQSDVNAFFKIERPDQVYLCAAKVGGILANNNLPADFIYQNLMIQANVINAAFQNGVKKVLFLGSSCIYPREAVQPLNEEALLTGPLEPTNEPYAIAKIAGIKLCESYNRQYGRSHGVDYRSVMPTNLYGPGDNYHPTNSHVIPGLIRRIHDAKVGKAPSVVIWGTGKPLREFLYVDDMAAASVFVMNLTNEVYQNNTDPRSSHINVGVGSDITIKELGEMISRIVEFKGEIIFDESKPDGVKRKLLDVSRIKHLGWSASISLETGLLRAYKDFLDNKIVTN